MEAGILGLLLVGLLLPISDVAAAALTYMRTYQAMRNVAAYALYNPPADVTKPDTTWPRLPNAMPGFTITPVSSALATSAPSASIPGATISIWITVLCGDPTAASVTCDPTNPAIPKWFYLISNVSLKPIFLTGLTGGRMYYSQQFQ